MNDPTSPSDGTSGARVHRLRGAGAATDADDVLAVEAPLEIRMGGVSTVLLRTPGDDEDLIHGFLLSEGVIADPAEILGIRGLRDASGTLRGSIVEVDLAPGTGRTAAGRFLYSSSSCGACGKTSIGELTVRGERCTSATTVSRDVLMSLPARMRAAQSAFDATGGMHGSALFSAAGDFVAVREDVGRHNALDKLIGWASRTGRIPLDGHILLLSGRVSFELVQKAVAGRVPVVAAVGAPSSLAVELAREFDVTLAGFVRPGSLNLYSRPDRVAGAITV